ncbi:MAG: radical SAM protein [Paramuribaculum sp.]|nr:radical SAM protein [Paramuribaculum sp.]
MIQPHAKIIGISRHRIVTDGDGVTTLVAFHGCQLRCLYCLNPQSIGPGRRFRDFTPQTLYDFVKVDELYFLATNGGVTFGGGEPAMHPDFICQFRDLCGGSWHLTIETSLNVPTENIKALLPVVDSWIIDIKDMNPDIYRRYTGNDNSLVESNLQLLATSGRTKDCLMRLPRIPKFNSGSDCEKSRDKLSELGFNNFDMFNYQLHHNAL